MPNLPETGMERSFAAINDFLPLLKIAPPVFRGARQYITNGCPVRSDAVHHLIALAKTASSAQPIYVMGLACATNLASAILLDPSIRENVVMTWTAGYPTNVTNIQNSSFNLQQDVDAAQVLFSSGVPLVYLPGFYIGQQFTLSLPDVTSWFKDAGPLGKFLYAQYRANPLFKWYGIDPADLTGRIWNIWDVVNGAWLVSPGSVSSDTVATPKLSECSPISRHQ
jgi:purine nucleosidase